MSVIQVGLVDKTGKLDPSLVESTAAALNIQVMRDLPQYWNVQATVRHLPNPKKIPLGSGRSSWWRKLPPGEGGVHLDKKNQPYSLVIGTPDNDDWTIDASHETLEMLVDPFGNRLQTSRAIKIHGKGVEDTTGEFEYLVEACDPVRGQSVRLFDPWHRVSDFITPHFYDPVVTAGTRYSFGGNIKKPRQMLPGGYISFIDPQKDECRADPVPGRHARAARPRARPAGESLRVFVDGKTREKVRSGRTPNQALTQANRQHREILRRGGAAKRGKAVRGRLE